MVLVTFSVGPPLPDDLDLPLTLRHGVPQATPPDAGRLCVAPRPRGVDWGWGIPRPHGGREREAPAVAETPDPMVADARGEGVQSPLKKGLEI